MTYTKKISVYIIFSTGFFLLFSQIALATNYVPLEPGAFPGIDTAGDNLGPFLATVFNWGLAVIVMLALVMIIWGGIKYMTTDSFMGKSEGKDRIQDALKGLGLALISWLLLYIINPTLVTFQGNSLLGQPQQTTQQTPTNNAFVASGHTTQTIPTTQNLNQIINSHIKSQGGLQMITPIQGQALQMIGGAPATQQINIPTPK